MPPDGRAHARARRHRVPAGGFGACAARARAAAPARLRRAACAQHTAAARAAAARRASSTFDIDGERVAPARRVRRPAAARPACAIATTKQSAASTTSTPGSPHLLLCASAPAGVAAASPRGISRDGRFFLQPSATPRARAGRRWCALYAQGLREPLHFFPRVGLGLDRRATATVRPRPSRRSGTGGFNDVRARATTPAYRLALRGARRSARRRSRRARSYANARAVFEPLSAPAWASIDASNAPTPSPPTARRLRLPARRHPPDRGLGRHRQDLEHLRPVPAPAARAPARRCSSILVVTFTNAATAELRERIRQRIVDTLAWLRAEQAGEPPPSGDDFVERLRRARAREPHGLRRPTTWSRASSSRCHLRRGLDLHDPRLLPARAGRHAVHRADAVRAGAGARRRRLGGRGRQRLLAPPHRRRRPRRRRSPAIWSTSKDSPERFAALLQAPPRQAAGARRLARRPRRRAAAVTPTRSSRRIAAARARCGMRERDAIVDAADRRAAARSTPTATRTSSAAHGRRRLGRAAARRGRRSRALDAGRAQARPAGRGRARRAARRRSRPTPQHAFFDVAAAPARPARRGRRRRWPTARLALLRALLDEGAAGAARGASAASA